MKDIIEQPEQKHAQAKQGGRKPVTAQYANGGEFAAREHIKALFDADPRGRINDTIFRETPVNAPVAHLLCHATSGRGILGMFRCKRL